MASGHVAHSQSKPVDTNSIRESVLNKLLFCWTTIWLYFSNLHSNSTVVTVILFECFLQQIIEQIHLSIWTKTEITIKYAQNSQAQKCQPDGYDLALSLSHGTRGLLQVLPRKISWNQFKIISSNYSQTLTFIYPAVERKGEDFD